MTEFLKNNISKKICLSTRYMANIVCTVLFNCYQILVPHLFCIQFKIFTMNTHREKKLQNDIRGTQTHNQPRSEQYFSNLL